MSASLLYEMIDSGELPNLAGALEQNGVRVEEAIAPFPTISFYAHTCILTGCWADKHGITAIRWLDRRTGNNRSYAGFGSELIDGDINPEVKTVFEYLEDLPTVSIGSVVHRGADDYVRPWLPPDSLRIRSLMQRFKKKSPPALSVVVLTGIDWPAHRYGPKSEWVRIDLRKLDREMGKLFTLLKRHGLDRSTYVMLTADHGHSSVTGRIDLYSHLTSLGFDILDKFLYTARTEGFTDHDAVLWMAGVGYAFLYLPVRTDTHLDWKDRPAESMLRAYPVGGPASGIHASRDTGPSLAGGRRVDLIDDLASLPQIAFIAIRDPAGGQVSYFSSEGRLDPDRDLAAFPDAAVQIPHLMAAHRAPDILVVAKDGYETAWSWHKGRHGGYSRDEMIVPLIVIGPGIRPQRILRARTIDIAPTILKLMGRSDPEAPFDGKTLEF
ncbi:alkaline phosphatase family protein [bacterium]|nr:alkaline phosphatase family protein [bacterium]